MREESAVYEAASTFNGSRFKEFEYAGVDISITEAVGSVSIVELNWEEEICRHCKVGIGETLP